MKEILRQWLKAFLIAAIAQGPLAPVTEKDIEWAKSKKLDKEIKMKCSEIIREYLVKNGLDGLVNVECECACEIDDLFTCGEWFADCEPGHKEPCDCEHNDHNFHIVAERNEDGPTE